MASQSADRNGETKTFPARDGLPHGFRSSAVPTQQMGKDENLDESYPEACFSSGDGLLAVVLSGEDVLGGECSVLPDPPRCLQVVFAVLSALAKSPSVGVA